MLHILNETAAEGHCLNRFCGSKRGLLILNSSFSINKPLRNTFSRKANVPPTDDVLFQHIIFFYGRGRFGAVWKVKKISIQIKLYQQDVGCYNGYNKLLD